MRKESSGKGGRPETDPDEVMPHPKNRTLPANRNSPQQAQLGQQHQQESATRRGTPPPTPYVEGKDGRSRPRPQAGAVSPHPQRCTPEEVVEETSGATKEAVQQQTSDVEEPDPLTQGPKGIKPSLQLHRQWSGETRIPKPTMESKAGLRTVHVITKSPPHRNHLPNGTATATKTPIASNTNTNTNTTTAITSNSPTASKAPSTSKPAAISSSTAPLSTVSSRPKVPAETPVAPTKTSTKDKSITTTAAPASTAASPIAVAIPASASAAPYAAGADDIASRGAADNPLEMASTTRSSMAKEKGREAAAAGSKSSGEEEEERTRPRPRAEVEGIGVAEGGTVK